MFAYSTMYDTLNPTTHIFNGWLAWEHFCRDVRDGDTIVVKKIRLVCGDLIVSDGQVAYSKKFGFSFESR